MLSSPSALDATDPYLREAQTFPRLDADMVARIARYGAEETIPADRCLYRRGDRAADFFLVLDGEVETFDEDSRGERRVFTCHRAGQFLGETVFLNGRESLVTNQARVETGVVRVPRPEFRRMLAAEPDVSEVVMRAFILRRMSFLRHGLGGVTLLGPSHCAETLRLQRFMTRNAYPHRMLASDVDPEAAATMERLGLGGADLPAVIAPGRVVLRVPTTWELADRLGLTEPLDESTVFDVAVVGAGPASPPRPMPPPRGCGPSRSRRRRLAARPARRRRSRTISDSPPASPARRSPGEARPRRRSSAPISRSRARPSRSTAAIPPLPDRARGWPRRQGQG